MDNQLKVALQNIKDAFILHEEKQITSEQLVSIVKSRTLFLNNAAEKRSKATALLECWFNHRKES